MSTYVAFLRAINLGARRRVPMAKLSEVLERAGFEDVSTHLATGNVRLESRRRSTAGVEDAVEQALLSEFGFEVPTVALTLDDLHRIVEQVDEVVPDVKRTYVTLLKQEPPAGLVHDLDSWSAQGEGAKVGHRSVLWWADHDMHQGTLANDVVEKQLGVATTRTTKVIRTVHDKWGG